MVATDVGVLLISAVGVVDFTAPADTEVWRRHLAVMLDGLPWPRGTLTISELFPGEIVVFPFEQLAPARQAFAECFAPGK